MTVDRYDRQSFLGVGSQRRIEECTVAAVGLGGGGSHIVQQLAHLGFRNYVIYDFDRVEDSNLNRLIGATVEDARLQMPKVVVAERLIRGLQPDAVVESYQCRWQDHPIPLRAADLVFGCVDTFQQRHELEVCARRYLLPYIDIGMDVHQCDGEAPVMAGQVILSMPGEPCMWCLGFLTDERLGQEARKYGNTGGQPQVVWPNAILASTAVGIGIEVLTDWTRAGRLRAYLSYNGNLGTIEPHVRAKFAPPACRHYPASEMGDPVAREL